MRTRQRGADVVLWHIEVSHYNEKARWALDHKAVPHVRRAPLPLYPADPDERARALALEEELDESLGPPLRRCFWQHTLDDPDAVIEALGVSGGRARAVRALLPVRRSAPMPPRSWPRPCSSCARSSPPGEAAPG